MIALFAWGQSANNFGHSALISCLSFGAAAVLRFHVFYKSVWVCVVHVRVCACVCAAAQWPIAFFRWIQHAPGYIWCRLFCN